MLQTSRCDETTLVKNAIAGDANAFGELYQIYLNPIYRYIYQRVGNVHDAEDLAEQVFLKAWEALPQYKDRGYRFSSWLYRIAHNAVIDYHRRQKYTIPITRVGGEEWLSRQRSLAEQVIADEEVAELSTALDQLPEEQQQVIKLRFRDGLNHGEIARAINKSAGASRMIQHRALSTLGELLDGKAARTVGVALTVLVCLVLVRSFLTWWQQALPGNLFYTAKRNIETVQITAAGSTLERAQLHLHFAERRVAEVRRLLEQQQPDELASLLAAYQTEINTLQSFFGPQSTLSTAEQEELAAAFIRAETDQEAQLLALTTAAPVGLRTHIDAAIDTARLARASALQVIQGEAEENPADKGEETLPPSTPQSAPLPVPSTSSPSPTPTLLLVPTATPQPAAVEGNAPEASAPETPVTSESATPTNTPPAQPVIAPTEPAPPPTATLAPVNPTATPQPTDTPLPLAPTDTLVPPPTNTPVPPTVTPLPPPPTHTPLPPPTATPASNGEPLLPRPENWPDECPWPPPTDEAWPPECPFSPDYQQEQLENLEEQLESLEEQLENLPIP